MTGDSCEKYSKALACLLKVGELLKREAGVSPARTRHCIKRADTGRKRNLIKSADGRENRRKAVLSIGAPKRKTTGKSSKRPGRCVSALTFKSGDLPVVCTETAEKIFSGEKPDECKNGMIRVIAIAVSLHG